MLSPDVSAASAIPPDAWEFVLSLLVKKDISLRQVSWAFVARVNGLYDAFDGRSQNFVRQFVVEKFIIIVGQLKCMGRAVGKLQPHRFYALFLK